MTAPIPLADAALTRCRRARLLASVAEARGYPDAADLWRQRASEWLSRAYDMAPDGWVPQTQGERL